MANLTFTLKEIEDLAHKVSALDQFLSKKEHELLLAIFASAAEQVTRNKASDVAVYSRPRSKMPVALPSRIFSSSSLTRTSPVMSLRTGITGCEKSRRYFGSPRLQIEVIHDSDTGYPGKSMTART